MSLLTEMSMPNFNEMNMLNTALCVFSALVTLFLLIGAVTDINSRKPFVNSFIVLLISNIIMQIGEAGTWLFEGSPENVTLLNISMLISMVFSYILISSYAYCLTDFVREKKDVSTKPAHIVAVMCGIFIVLSVVSVFNGIFFSYDDGGHLVYGPLYGLVKIFDLLCIICEMVFVLCFRKTLTLRGTLFLISFSVLPLLAMSLQFLWYPAPQYMATTLSLIVIFILFHGEITRQLAEKERQLTESRISVMLSQIQPHFLYNSINAIRELCRIDAEEARDALGDFAVYLRGNMDSLVSRTPVHFSKELKHIENYLKLEKLRFGDDLNIVYDIHEMDFFLPSLTVQPLVENAVKHGICEKEDGGTLTLRTYKDVETIVIEVIDDGIGFDIENSVRQEDGRSHIGIENVRNRLKQMCDGRLTIRSSHGKGTVATIRFSIKMEEA